MAFVIRAAWGLLALVHAAPAAVLFRPVLLDTLYGISPSGTQGVLLAHRGALFLGIVAACLFAVLSPESRRLASVVTGLSVTSYLMLYAKEGWPPGPLRGLAIADAVALALLALVAVMAWRS